MTDKKLIDAISYAAASAVFSVLIFFYAAYIGKVPEAPPLSDAAIEASVQFDIPQSAYPTSSAQACALIDANSGQLLFSKNENERLPMASTTKIMTAIIALENCDIDETVTIPAEVCGVEGSSIYLLAGEKLTMRELLYGLMLESGNDAATAVAIHVAGDAESFCELMNEKAKTLGLSNTHFDNPHGLTSENHYTTAHELALLSAYAMKNEVFRQLVSTDKYIIPERENCRARYFSNHNRLLRSFDLCDGVKTGYTQAAGRCLVTSGKSGDSRFVAVTLNDRQDWNDHKEMLTFAVENFESIKLADKNELVFNFSTQNSPSQILTVTNADTIYITRAKGSDDTIDLSVEIGKAESLVGDVAGYVRVNTDGNHFIFPLRVVGHSIYDVQKQNSFFTP